MSAITCAIILACLTCVGWGSVSLFLAKMPPGTHPLVPFFWNIMGSNAAALIVLVATNFQPLRAWAWNGPGAALAVIWPAATLTYTLALYLAPQRASVLNALAAAYPALVSAPLLYALANETMSTQKIVGLLLAVAGVIIALLA